MTNQYPPSSSRTIMIMSQSINLAGRASQQEKFVDFALLSDLKL